jgi:hypothetical protein
MRSSRNTSPCCKQKENKIDSAARLEEMKKFGAVEGGNQTLDRLEQYLAGTLR